MPTYVYQCPSHGLFEFITSVANHVRETDCPDCGASSKQVLTIPPRAIGVEERSDTKYWRDSPTKFYMNDKRRKK
jgi:putative FmdB family regulatory protein